MADRKTLGRWQLLSLIDKTPHSRVWLGADDQDNQVAVKELKARKPEKEPYRRFRDEVGLLLRLGERAGVLPLIDADVPEDGGVAWLAMPLARTMGEALGDTPTLEDVVGAVAACARTLAALADEGVFHRDVKPNNLFERDGAWLVGDFGIATWPGKQALTEAGEKLGPAHFVAPEMVTNPAGADPGPADVWSLAKTLWVLAVGQNYPPPGTFRPDQPATTLRAQHAHPRAFGLESILSRATQLEPADRPSMRDFADELDAWLRPPVERPAPPNVEELARRVAAVTAPAARAVEARLVRDHESSLLFVRLRDNGLHKLHNAMDTLGLVHVGDQALCLHDLGGASGRHDAVTTGAEAFNLSPHGSNQVALTAEVGYEVFADDSVHMVAGIYVRVSGELPDVVWLETRRAALGSERAAHDADELASGLIGSFAEAATRFTQALEEAEARRPRQPLLESEGENFTFRTDPDEAGTVVVTDKRTGEVAHALGWGGTPFADIRADGDRLLVRTGTNKGWITRNMSGTWALSDSWTISQGDSAPDEPT